MENINSISALKKYIENHLGDNGEAWELVHTPHIRGVVGRLDENDSDIFSREIFNWPLHVFYELADPIIYPGNKYLPRNKYLKDDYLYCKIFSLTDDLDSLAYLAQNLAACFYCLKPEDCDIEMFKEIRIRLSSVLETATDKHWVQNYNALLKSIDGLVL